MRHARIIQDTWLGINLEGKDMQKLVMRLAKGEA